MIEIALENPTVMAGHFLVAQVRWSSDRVPRRIAVAAEWQASSFNGSSRGVGRATMHQPGRGEHGGSFPVHLLIPHEGPLSFAGQVLTIEWNLWARVDQPGADEFAHQPFRVIPRQAT